MFTGIVEELGECRALVPAGESAALEVSAPKVAVDLAVGASVAVNGVCLTAVEVHPGGFRADVVAETLRRSSLAALTPGAPVNLERPLTLSTRLGGHLMQGHVDAVGEVIERVEGAGQVRLRIGLPEGLAVYLVPQGSVAVDGVSLTVAAVAGATFEVSLIPATLAATTLGLAGAASRVNIEVDVIAKYVQRLLGGRVDGQS